MSEKELMKLARELFGVSAFSEDFFKRFEVKREQVKTRGEARAKVSEYKKRGFVATYKRFDFSDLARESVYEVVAIKERERAVKCVLCGCKTQDLRKHLLERHKRFLNFYEVTAEEIKTIKKCGEDLVIERNGLHDIIIYGYFYGESDDIDIQVMREFRE